MRKFLQNAKPWQILTLIMVFSTLIRFWGLGNPRAYVFDEVYHGFTAKMYAAGRYEAWVWWTSPPEGVAYEWTHPPLAKVIMSWSIQALGGPGELPTKITDPARESEFSEEDRKIENQSSRILSTYSYGPRASGALFGVFCTLGLYFLAKSWFRNAWVGALAAFLFCIDLLPLVQSRTAMNDIYAVTFLVWGLYFFTRRSSEYAPGISAPNALVNYRLAWWRWLAAGALIGCAISSKWTSFFALGMIATYHIFTLIFSFIYLRREEAKIEYVRWTRFVGRMLWDGLRGVICFALIPLVIYLLSYWQMFTLPIKDYQGNLVQTFLEDYERNMKSGEENLVNLQKQLAEANFEYKSSEELKKDIAKQEADIRLLRNEKPLFENLYQRNTEWAQRMFIWWGVQKQMWWYHTNLVATHDYTSQWWSWPLMIRPVWFYVGYCGENSGEAHCETRLNIYTNSVWSKIFPFKTELIIDQNDPTKILGEDPIESMVADVYTMGNPLLYWSFFPFMIYFAYLFLYRYRWWFLALPLFATVLLLRYGLTYTGVRDNAGLMMQAQRVFIDVFPAMLLFAMLLLGVIAVVAMVEGLFDKRDNAAQHYRVPLVVALLCFFTFWLPWARSPRIMFYYHFFPPVTFMYVFLAGLIYSMIKSSREMRLYAWTFLIVCTGSFVYFYPHVTAVYLPEVLRTQYWWFPTWR